MHPTGDVAAGVVPTPDGLHWLSSGTDDRVRLWDASTYRHVLMLARLGGLAVGIDGWQDGWEQWVCS